MVKVEVEVKKSYAYPRKVQKSSLKQLVSSPLGAQKKKTRSQWVMMDTVKMMITMDQKARRNTGQ